MSGPGPTPTILVVDDDPALLVLIERALRAEQWNVATASSGAAADAWLRKHSAELLLLDLTLNDIDGREFIETLSGTGRRLPFIVITGPGDVRVAVELMKRGALDYLVKDDNFIEFIPAVVHRALARLADERRLAEAEAASSESRFLTQAVVNSLTAHIAVLDEQGKILAVNEPWRKFARENGDPAFERTGIGANYLEICRRAIATSEQNAAVITSGIRAVIDRSRSSYSIEYPCRGPGRERWFAMSVTPLEKDRGGVVVSHLEITRRKQAEEALREANEFGKQVIGGAEAGIIVYDRDGRIIVWNPFMEQLTGCRAQEVLGCHAREAFPFLNQQRFEKVFDRALAGEVFDAADIPFDLPETGRRGWTLARFAPWRDARQEIVGAIAAIRDITDRRRLESELLEVTDREQQRIGHDLHDGLGQQLTGLEMKCFLFLQDLAADDLAARRTKLLEQARQMNQVLRECITATRSIARGLAPVVLKTEGLPGALEQLAHRTRVPGQLECSFVCRGPANIDSVQTAKHLYRIAQEAVNNALKHARTRRIDIGLECELGVLRLRIKDSGRGLPRVAKARTGMGLEVMRHRAHVIGASLEIDSRPGKGVSVTCTLPIKES
jgi:PAS domain S-box-containing protein